MDRSITITVGTDKPMRVAWVSGMNVQQALEGASFVLSTDRNRTAGTSASSLENVSAVVLTAASPSVRVPTMPAWLESRRSIGAWLLLGPTVCGAEDAPDRHANRGRRSPP